MLIGKAPAHGAHDLRLLVTLRDSAGHVTRSEVVLAFGHGGVVASHAHHIVPHAANHPAHTARVAAAKPSLAAQFAQQQRALHVARRAIV
jgi:trimeric autotransporter adhesin